MKKFEIRQCKNPRWSNDAKTAVEVEVEWKHMRGALMPFTANKDDSTEHGRKLFDRIVAGEFGEIAEKG